jgi:hypothetical protein
MKKEKITDPNGYPIFPEKTTAELIAEARKLFRKDIPTPVPKPLTKKEQEFEQHKKEIEKKYRGKIPYDIFERAFDY